MATTPAKPASPQLPLFGDAASGSSSAKLTKRRIQSLAKSLMVPDARCETCGIIRCDAIFGSAEDGRTYIERYPALDGWRDVETGAPAALPVEYDEFPPSGVELAAYYLRSNNTFVVRCNRHRPRNGKKVEVR